MKYAQRTDASTLPPEVTRLVVLGDPHGDVAGLEAVVAREGRQGTAYLSVGDNVGYGGGQASSLLCERLQELGALSVHGNHESWLTEAGALAIVTPHEQDERSLTPAALAWSKGLPWRLRLRFAAAPGLQVSVRHTLGTRWDYVQQGNAHYLALEEAVPVVFVGHSHGARIFAIGAQTAPPLELGLTGEESVTTELEPGLSYVVDAGSLARPGYHPAPGRFEFATYATLDLGTRRVAIHALRKAI